MIAAGIDRALVPRGPAERLLLGNLVEAMLLGDEPADDVISVGLRALGSEADYDEMIGWGTSLYPVLAQLVVCDADRELLDARIARALELAVVRGSSVSR